MVAMFEFNAQDFFSHMAFWRGKTEHSIQLDHNTVDLSSNSSVPKSLVSGLENSKPLAEALELFNHHTCPYGFFFPLKPT